MKRTAVCLAIILVLLFSFARAEAPDAQAVEELLQDMLDAYNQPSPEAEERVSMDAAAINHPVITAVAEHWKEVFLDPDYRMYYYKTDDPKNLEIPDPSRHAFVVLGFRLRDGEMEPELQGRCRAAAAVAKAYPEAIVICTGGATGNNNPDRNTEAGMMGSFLRRKCGIKQSRIRLDKDARTTVENTLNSFRIMQKEGIRTVTVVTSGYHMRWSLALFNAAAAWYREQGTPIELIGNWCYDIRPGTGYDAVNVNLTISQLRSLLTGGPDALFPAGE